MKDLVSLPARSGGAVLVVVETPAGSRVKLKLDSELGHVTVSRPLPLGLHYPFDWGFIPSTRAADGSTAGLSGPWTVTRKLSPTNWSSSM